MDIVSFFFLFGFPEGFFCFLWYFWFSRRIFWFCKNLRENNKNKKNKPISKGESETFNFVCLVFHISFGFSLVFFGIFGFLEGFFGFVKTFGKTKTTNKSNPYPRVSLKPLTLFVWFFIFFFGFLWFSLVFLVFPKVF